MGLIKIGKRGSQLQAPIQSSLLLGLGGTGKQVLLQIRRKFFERWAVKGFPVMSYLWIDTDMRNIGLDDQPLDYLLQEVVFDEDEKGEVKDLSQNAHHGLPDVFRLQLGPTRVRRAELVGLLGHM